jgi:hypothetical protein
VLYQLLPLPGLGGGTIRAINYISRNPHSNVLYVRYICRCQGLLVRHCFRRTPSLVETDFYAQLGARGLICYSQVI